MVQVRAGGARHADSYRLCLQLKVGAFIKVEELKDSAARLFDEQAVRPSRDSPIGLSYRSACKAPDASSHSGVLVTESSSPAWIADCKTWVGADVLDKTTES